MPFTLIKGTFHVVNYSPDGDSVRFKPANLALLQTLSGAKPNVNARGHTQLRIEAIDALETHYAPPSGGGVLHQPLVLAYAARVALLAYVNITGVVWDAKQSTVVAANDGTPGYILARSVEKNGRPVAFVFAGDAPEADGALVLLDEARMQTSFNYLALAQGLAYPTYYTGLFFDLRNAMTAAVVKARQQKLGIHRDDVTTKGVTINSLAIVIDQFPILPKLFRRISEYVGSVGSIKGFKESLAKAKEPVYDLRQGNFTHFDTFIEQKGNRIRLTRRPEELVFDELPTQPVPAFSLLLSRAELLLLEDDVRLVSETLAVSL